MSRTTSKLPYHLLILCITFLCLTATANSQAAGKPPVIIIPGISGSQLINPITGNTVWFSVKRDKEDDLRLPMKSAILAKNDDTLKVGDIIREVELPVLPDIEVYDSVIKALQDRGYTEATWDNPQATDVFYVFPYDWRRDNVETAHLLIKRIASAKAALKRPDLKFDILAHSMGGLIARYAAMYGTAELPKANPKPTWAGSRHIGKLMMFGTPNAGSFGALNVLVNGYPIIAGRNLPLVDDLRPEDVITSPSIFQLLPHAGSARFYDDRLNKIDVDLYDIANWEKYGWSAFSDPKFLSKLKDAAALAKKNKDIKPATLDKDANFDDGVLTNTTYAQVRSYLVSALNRAKRFHAALEAPAAKAPIQIFAYGGNCEPTLAAVILKQEEKNGQWRTLFDAKDLKDANGQEIKKDVVKAAMFRNGDGRVTENSVLASTDKGNSAAGKSFPLESSFFACSSHTKLFLEKPIQDSFLSALVVEQHKQP